MGSKFYTQNGWEGNKYDIELSTKDIAKLIRQKLKKNLPDYKFSVTMESFSGGSSISIALMAAPIKVFVDKIDTDNLRYPNDDPDHAVKYLDQVKKSGRMQVNHYHFQDDINLTPRAKVILRKAMRLLNSYRRSDTDSQIDYFSNNYYVDLEIGRYEKPLQITA